MEVLNRINAFLGIMFVALLLEAIIFSFMGGGDIAGHAFKISALNDKEVKQELNLEITKGILNQIELANSRYLEGNIIAARKEFDKLIEMRIEAGGMLRIERFTELLPQLESGLIFKQEKNSEAGFILLSKNRKIIADKVDDIGRIIRKQDTVFNTLLYIFYPKKYASVVPPNKWNKINYGGKYYYYYRGANGELIIKNYKLLWFDSKLDNEDIKNSIMASMVDSLIDEKKIDILLSKDHLYKFVPDKPVKKSTIGRAFTVIDELSLS